MTNRGAQKQSKGKAPHVIWWQQWLYAWNSAKTDLLQRPWSTLLTIMVIAISLTLPTSCYLLWKNTSIAMKQWYPSPQLTVYLKQSLTNEQAKDIAAYLGRQQEIAEVIFLNREEALKEFRSWSGFDEALNMLPDNPLPAVAMLIPEEAYKTTEKLQLLRSQIQKVSGVEDVRLDDGWLNRLTALNELIALVALSLSLLMVASVFLVIGNSVRLSIFSRRQTINVMKLIGATDGFIMRPFLNSGSVLGATGALLAIIFSQLMIWRLTVSVSQVASVFNTSFDLLGLNIEEILLVILLATMIGWVAAWMATMQHLQRNISS